MQYRNVIFKFYNLLDPAEAPDASTATADIVPKEGVPCHQALPALIIVTAVGIIFPTIILWTLDI